MSAYNKYRIRPAKPEDAERLLEIYSYYVENTAITFEIEVPSLEEFRERIAHTLENYPYIVAEEIAENSDKKAAVVGYAYAGRFHEREAYSRCVEMSIYLDRSAKRNGLGRLLYENLEESLRKMGILNLYACIGYPANGEDEYLSFDSVKFHEKMGYKLNGQFHNCGCKFGRWYDMVWMEKIIGEHTNCSPA